MRIPTMLIALLLPACGEGTTGISPPPLLDMTAIVRPKSPNTALAAPADFQPVPDIVTRTYPMPPPLLYAAVKRMAAAQTRVFGLKDYDPQLQAHYVARSALIGFPDLVTIQVLDLGVPGSGLVLWSRSVYGHSDLGVNRKRLTAWLAALEAGIGA